jgi:hypothetical protein
MGHITFLSMCMLSRHQNAGHNHYRSLANKSFENLTLKLNFSGTNVTDQNLIPEEIKRALNSGNASHRSVPNFLSSRLHSEHKI